MSAEQDNRMMFIGLRVLQVFDSMPFFQKIAWMDTVRKCQCAGCLSLRQILGEQLKMEFIGKGVEGGPPKPPHTKQ